MQSPIPTEAPATSYPGALAILRDVAHQHGCTVRRLESRRHLLVRPGGMVACGLAMRGRVPVVVNGWRCSHLRPADCPDAAAVRSEILRVAAMG